MLGRLHQHATLQTRYTNKLSPRHMALQPNTALEQSAQSSLFGAVPCNIAVLSHCEHCTFKAGWYPSLVFIGYMLKVLLVGDQATRQAVVYLRRLGTGLGEVHELAQSQGVQAGDVKLHLLPRPTGQAWIAGVHQRHCPLKLLARQSIQGWDQSLLQYMST